jgi:predicted DCC family thiol-disulfide oxidoreductase YuxK
MAERVKTSVFYDGSCRVCREAIEDYRRADRAGTIDFVDISAEGFDARSRGLDPAAVWKSIHVRAPEGEVATGIDGLIAVWRLLPGYGWRARLASIPGIRFLLSMAYRLVASNRHLSEHV